MPNVLRLLNFRRVMLNTPQNAFKMNTWGHKCQPNSDGYCRVGGTTHEPPACGTVGCAAGNCAYDPWFVENGFPTTKECGLLALDTYQLQKYFEISPDTAGRLFHDYTVTDPKEIARRIAELLAREGVRCG